MRAPSVSPAAPHLQASRHSTSTARPFQALTHPWFACLGSEAGPDAGAASLPPLVPATADAAAALSLTPAAGPGGPLCDSVVQRLQRFGTYGRLKRIALRGIASVAMTVAGDSDALRELEAAFWEMDVAGDGRVPYRCGGPGWGGALTSWGVEECGGCATSGACLHSGSPPAPREPCSALDLARLAARASRTCSAATLSCRRSRCSS